MRMKLRKTRIDFQTRPKCLRKVSEGTPEQGLAEGFFVPWVCSFP